MARHAKNIFVILLLNIFITMVVTVLYEYINLADRFNDASRNIRMAANTALEDSLAAEELFTNEYQDFLRSNAVIQGHSVESTSSTVAVYDKRTHDWYAGNIYVLAQIWNSNGHKIPTMSEYNSSHGSKGQTNSIYQWLFGEPGSEYTDFQLEWANNNVTIIEDDNEYIHNPHRTPTTQFRNFYNNIGKEIKIKGNIKEKTTRNGKETFNVTKLEYPVLCNMGLDLDALNSTGSHYTNDNFSMVAHVGKVGNATTTGDRASMYYLTPYSLGVTYVPVEVFKPAFTTTLDTIVRLQKLSSADLSETASATQVFDSATGCIQDISLSGGTSPYVHTNASGNDIINDGYAEYDLTSVKTRVDYYLIDFYNTDYKSIVAAIEGVGTAQKGLPNGIAEANNVEDLKASDTARHGNKQDFGSTPGNRIVAKVTVSMKLYIPYNSTLLRWSLLRYFGTSGNNHYSVKTYDASHQTLDQVESTDGVWYTYSTYVAITR